MVNLTFKKIQKLRPTFKFGGITMVEWFEITQTGSFCCIRSGLRHADGITKSPYHYEECTVGKKADKEALKKFTEWWLSLKQNKKTPSNVK